MQYLLHVKFEIFSVLCLCYCVNVEMYCFFTVRKNNYGITQPDRIDQTESITNLFDIET